eukprot:g3404.t1
MIVIILVASIDTELERAIGSDPKYSTSTSTSKIPKALLPIYKDTTTMLDLWWDAFRLVTTPISNIYLVSSGKNYKFFERFATAKGLPISHVVNNGITTSNERLGAARDLLKGLIRASSQQGGIIDEDVAVIGGEAAFYEGFDVDGPLRYFKEYCAKKKDGGGSLCLTYALGRGENASERGIATIDPVTRKVLNFREKPSEVSAAVVGRNGGTKEVPEEEESQEQQEQHASSPLLAVPLFYIFRKSVVPILREFVTQRPLVPAERMGCGHFMEWLHSKHDVYAMRLPSGFGMIGAHVGLKEYLALRRREPHRLSSASAVLSESASAKAEALSSSSSISRRAYARVGLMGNPSDGFYGKTIALTIQNYWAEVTLRPSDRIQILPHPLYDPMEFASLSTLYDVARREGYQGGVRLLMGTCKRFFELCVLHGVALPKRCFSLAYDTNIPRQVGLAGSSAIVTATFRCLMDFFRLSDMDIPKPMQPQFVLDVEMRELNINAGLQDRVVQCYEGLVYMDFSKDIFERKRHGEYVQLSSGQKRRETGEKKEEKTASSTGSSITTTTSIRLPTLWLCFVADPSDSGKIHSDVRRRWENGEAEVVAAMREFARLTDRARVALESGDSATFAKLMNANFDLRRKIYGDACVGKDNLRMIEIAREHGCAAKFPGSGGAIVGTCQDAKMLSSLEMAYEQEGFVFVRIVPHGV